MPETAVPPIGPEGARLILSHAVYSRPFLLRARPSLNPAAFPDPAHAAILRAAVDHFDETSQPAGSPEALLHRLSVMQVSRAIHIAATDLARVHQEANALPRETAADVAWIVSQAGDMARRHAVVTALQQSIEDVSRGDLDAAIARVSGAGTVGGRGPTQSSRYFENVIRRSRAQRGAIPTGYQLLDDLIEGIVPGELGIIEAPPGRFKTGLGLNFGANAIRAGYDVLHASAETTVEQLEHRYDGALFGLRRGENTSERLRALFDEVRAEGRWGAPYIGFWPIGTATTGDVRAWMHQMVGEGAGASGKLLLIVDSPMILRPTRRSEVRREEIRDTYRELIPIAYELGAGCWAPMQANRSAMTKSLIGMEDLAECFAVAADASIILSLNCDTAELGTPRMRLYVVKSRDSAAFRVLNLDIDFEAQRIVGVTPYTPPPEPERRGAQQRRPQAPPVAQPAQPAFATIIPPTPAQQPRQIEPPRRRQ